MPELTPPSGSDDLFLETELERLFALQDKPLTKEKKRILVQELLGTGMPIPAILAGIRTLATEDLSSIKFGTICAAARRHIEPVEDGAPRCDHCMRGIVVMRDENRLSVALACICERGQGKAATHGLARWNGQAYQHSKGRQLEICR